MNNKLKKIILLGGDLTVLYVSLYLTLLIRYQAHPPLASWQSHLGPFSIIFLAWILIFYISDLYNLHLAVNNSKFFQLTIRSIAIAGLLSVTFFYLNPRIGISPKTNLLIYLGVITLLFILWRRIFNWLLYSRLPKNRLAIIGFNEQVKELIKSLAVNPHLGYEIALIASKEEVAAGNIAATAEDTNLKQLLIDKKISTIVLAANPHDSPELRSALFSCLPLKINFMGLPRFYELVTGKVPLEAINQMWFLENLSEGNKSGFDMFKRIYDIILALFILLLTAPLWPIIGLIIKIESRGPIFFKQVRAGKNNKKFTIIKFRTMTVNNNNFTPTKSQDARVNRFGGFLRSARIDEIPQVLNIMTGGMSFVGPRPERPELIKKLEQDIPFYHERMLVKPGLTGWDQISGEYHSPSRADTIKKLQYDLFYIKNRSIYLDLSIILKTIATVLSKSGM